MQVILSATYIILPVLLWSYSEQGSVVATGMGLVLVSVVVNANAVMFAVPRSEVHTLALVAHASILTVVLFALAGGIHHDDVI